jgi:hypothetical protein
MMDDATHYKQLEIGARFLASRAASEAERIEHLGWANRYYRLGADADCQPTAAVLEPV